MTNQKQTKKQIRNCKGCKSEFLEYKSSKRVYCDPQCRISSIYEDIICGVCGTKFTELKCNNRKFCSTECGHKGRVKGGLKGEKWYKAMEHVDLGKAWRGKKNPGQSKRMKGNIPWNKGKVGVQPGYWTGKTRSKKTIRKIRKTKIKKLEEKYNNGFQLSPNYNPNSISIIEQKAEELGIVDLQHAENGGEFYIEQLGFWVDGYSKSKNVVIEYYERWHKHNKDRDERRKKEIVEHLNCKFVEIYE